jgi:hypothetical protein
MGVESADGFRIAPSVGSSPRGALRTDAARFSAAQLLMQELVSRTEEQLRSGRRPRIGGGRILWLVTESRWELPRSADLSHYAARLLVLFLHVMTDPDKSGGR